MIEKAPKTIDNPTELIDLLNNPDYQEAFKVINDKYLYWNKAKYYRPKEISPEVFWSAIKLSRRGESLNINEYHFSFKITNKMWKRLHDFDLFFCDNCPTDNKVDGFFQLNDSKMEEAIASSKMEGANTTIRIAKEMLLKNKKPMDTSQQMIVNNYKTIRFLSNNLDTPLTSQFILDIHKSMTQNTLLDSKYEGIFRDTNDIVVMDELSSEIVHIPPSSESIKEFISKTCDFINKDDDLFIHPIIKAIILHFLISFLHPFVDGNGRTARALFYWYMLKQGYSLIEYLAISKIIYEYKPLYEKAFLYTEIDDYDIGYFIEYNLDVLDKAYSKYQESLVKKDKENKALDSLKTSYSLSPRQLWIVRNGIENKSKVFTCKELETLLGVNAKTIRSDFESLVEKGIFTVVQINEKQRGYSLSIDFDEVIST